MLEKEKLANIIYQDSLDHIDSIVEARNYLEQGLTELAYETLKEDIVLFYTSHKNLYKLIMEGL